MGYHLFLIASVVIAFTSAQENDQCRTPPAGWPKRPPQCCDLPFPLENMKKQFGSCIRQIGRPSSAVPTAKAVRDTRLCIEECVYKGMGFFDKSLDKEAIAQELKKGVEKKTLWTKPMEAAIKTCFADTEKAEAEEEAACDHAPHVFTHCVMRQLFLNCPSSQWKSSDECNLVKERMEVCPNIPPPPPPPPQQRPGAPGAPGGFPSQGFPSPGFPQ